MYPRLLQIPLPFHIGGIDTITIYSFGAMVAVAVLTAAWLARVEMDRLYAAGRLKGVRIPVADKGKNRRRTTYQVVSPSALVGTLVVMVVVFGFIGAKLFHILENLDSFMLGPLGMIFSSGGFTFYGGLIMAGLAIAWYMRKHDLNVPTVADALAPGLMLGYGIGRIGCHLAGDGDWGIPSNLSAKPDWLPTWLWAETYPHNILGVHIPPPGVYPTSVYEFLMAAALFGVLWAVRKHPFKAGWLFSLYLVLNGIERFLIELIRVNNEFTEFGVTFTQAEFIAVCLILAGGIGLAFTTRRRQAAAPATASSTVASTTA
ncbi:MAG TPA: prolipoprotein diacylglyceryl transferase family protein [Rhodothermales bacterium]|nr:prolipoprotein diacylglyceryl transferase family protein [Rhodothermales bacterium]